jgi:glycosyltransferase involved in cell wall biosynthesis
MKNQDVLKTLPQYDVILLTSDFEGMPIAILEGMGRGCVPVVSATRSGIPELVKDGQNGFIVRIGDIKSFADRLSLLQSNLQTRKDLSLRAYETIRDHYNLRKMAQDYLDFFQELQVQINRGLYRRPKGSIVSPPTLKLSWKQYLPNSVRSAGFYAKKLLRHKRFN